jgi:hypothetical protein
VSGPLTALSQKQIQTFTQAVDTLIAHAENDAVTLDDVLALGESMADCLVTIDPEVAPTMRTVRAAIALWRGYGPGGPFAPMPAWHPGPGNERGSL